jgi:DNA-directed RNA polymerase specialized sigma24 family protein
MDPDLRAMLALMVADREERLFGAPARRTEIVLVDAGLTLKDAATLTGKSYEAVKKSVQRNRARHPVEGNDGT